MAKVLFQEDIFTKIVGTDMFLEILDKEGFALNLPITMTFIKDAGIFCEQFYFCLN